MENSINRRWFLVSTFFTLLMFGMILVQGGNLRSFIFAVSAPISLAIFGTYSVHHLLCYYEAVKGIKYNEDEEGNK